MTSLQLQCHFLCLAVVSKLTELSELKFNYLLNFLLVG